MADDAALRFLYDAVEDRAKIQQLRNDASHPRMRSRLLRALWRLPQPAALQLLAWLVSQPWVQRRYLPGKTELVQQFLAGLVQPPKRQDLVGQCLFFGCLGQLGLCDAIFQRLRLERTIPVAGLDLLEAARIRRQGVILLGSHTYQTPYFYGLKLAQRSVGGMRFFLKTLEVDKTIAEQILCPPTRTCSPNIAARGRHYDCTRWKSWTWPTDHGAFPMGACDTFILVLPNWPC